MDTSDFEGAWKLKCVFEKSDGAGAGQPDQKPKDRFQGILVYNKGKMRAAVLCFEEGEGQVWGVKPEPNGEAPSLCAFATGLYIAYRGTYEVTPDRSDKKKAVAKHTVEAATWKEAKRIIERDVELGDDGCLSYTVPIENGDQTWVWERASR